MDSEASSLVTSANYQLTFQNKVSNWLWLDSQKDFEDELHLPGLIKNTQVIRTLRFLNLLLSVSDYALQIGTNI